MYGLALLTVYLVWGSTYLAMHYVVLDLPPFLAAGARFAAAGGALYLWLRAKGQPRPTWPQWKGGVVVGSLLLLGGNGGVMWAEQHVPSSLAAILIATVPLWVAVAEPLAFGGQRPRPLSRLAVVIGFAGVALLVGNPAAVAGARGGGVAVLLIAAFLWAMGSLVSGRVARPASALMGAAVQMLAGSLAILLFGTLLGEWSRLDVAHVRPSSWIGLAYLAAFGSVLAYSAYIWLLRNGPAATATTYAYVNPLVAILLGWAIADEVLTARTLLAGLVILGSVALLITVRARPLAPALPATAEAAGPPAGTDTLATPIRRARP